MFFFNSSLGKKGAKSSSGGLTSEPSSNRFVLLFGSQTCSVSVKISVNGSGFVKVDGMKLPSNNYQGKFYSNNELLLTAVSENGVFTGWSDGSTENPRKVQVSAGQTITANFK